MKVYLNEINGLWDAINAMYFSRRSWSREREEHLMSLYAENFDRWGKPVKNPLDPEMVKLIEMALRWSKTHITLGRFIDFSFTVEGLHRGAQDDFDSHARRLDNRIIRSSTRLAKFDGSEKSDFYKGAILTTDEALDALGIKVPDTVTNDGVVYVKCANGYVREEWKDDKDTLRGLYNLSIPSNFTFKCNLTEFAHIVNERDCDSHAHPELKEMMERCKELIWHCLPQLDTEWYRGVRN